MTEPSPPMPLWRVLLTLGRVSNLPTIWTNVWAGAVLAQAKAPLWALLCTMLALSASYVGGMFLNDAFDRDNDARLRPERPIPSGRISARAVFTLGFALLGLGALGVVLLAAVSGAALLPAGAIALSLFGCIVAYDVHHKQNILAPWLMGLCRALVYLSAAAALGGNVGAPLLVGALSLALYVVGLTFVARSELKPALESTAALALVFAPIVACIWLLSHHDGPNAFWLSLAVWLMWLLYCLRPMLRDGRVMHAVIHLIAGISLLDAAHTGAFAGTSSLTVGALGTAATLLLQRVARGT